MLAISLILSTAPSNGGPQLDSREFSEVPSLNLSAEACKLGNLSVALTVSDQDHEILDLLEKGKNGQAEKLILSRLAKAEGDKKSELLYLLACLDFQTHKYQRSLGKLKVILNGQVSAEHSEASARASQIKYAGDCYYRLHRTEQAIRWYKRGLLLAEADTLEPLRIDILESLTACLMEKEEYAEAKKYAEELVSRCRALSNNQELANIGVLFWSEISLLQIYKQLGDSANYDELRRNFIPLLRRLMHLRTELNAPLNTAQRLALPLRVKTLMLSESVAQHKPKTLAEYLWLVSTYRLRGLPLISWEPLDGSVPKAAIICVHAFGLENRAFEWFAAQMIERHFVVYAVDVRGFGSWQSEMGGEFINFGHALSDIRAVSEIIKELSPGVPVFLLGESMGGALVLQAASESGWHVNGVIASVPSAERYGETRMTLRVATHLLCQPRKPFNIVDRLALQATSNEELRTIWEEDPFSRHEFSPLELMRLNHFMIKTLDNCSLIRSTPVLIVQGLADRLVRPKGTYEMFDRVRSTDKAMIIIGSAEHLIFETTNQSVVLLDGLTAWLNNKVSKGNSSVSKPAGAANLRQSPIEL